jgi:hypothetical protein
MPVVNGSFQATNLRWLAGLVAALALLAALWAAPAAPAAVALPAIDTTITEGPAEGAVIADERPSFGFTATLADVPFPTATFRCSVDHAPAQPCTSPFQTEALEDGAHSFQVFAEDAEHFVADPTPAQRTFAIITDEEEECEAFEDEDGFEEDDAECEEERAADSRVPPEECMLRTARARLFTYSAQNRVRLVIRYTAFVPADVYVDYKLTGGKGTLKLGAAHQRFAKSGLFRLTERLNDAEMDKVRAAKRFTVVLNLPEAPRYCRRYDTRHLTIRRTVHNQAVWFQSDSIFGS